MKVADVVHSDLGVFDDLPHTIVEASPDLSGMLDPLLIIMAGGVGAFVQAFTPARMDAVEAPPSRSHGMGNASRHRSTSLL
ncbi:hypothetical protein ACFQZ2_03180 [Streptomonospora algeriensis]|uniref:Uncharacterized protein n=1 Tax=Streptomonospora algeriensis TaxID=995084 RepID=A0ABW3BDU1_9ACTN